MSSQNEQAPLTDSFSRLEQVSDVYSFAQFPHIEHRITPQGREIIRIDETVAYPRNITLGDPLADLVLEPAVEAGQFWLPLNYISFAHAFNEASGASTVDQGKTSAADELVGDLMRRLGESVGAVAMTDKLVPADIDYNSIVIGRDDAVANMPRFVPPLELVSVTNNADMLDKLRNATRTLNNRLHAAATPQQRGIVSMGMWMFREGVRSQTRDTGGAL
jgi:hypothetical protein